MSVTKLSRWEWLNFALAIVFLCLLCLGQLQRWQVTATVAVYAHDILLLGLIAINAPWWLTQITGWKQKFNLKGDWPVILLLGWAAAGWLLALVSGESLPTAIMYLGRLLAYLALNWQLLNASWWPKVVPWLKNGDRLPAYYWLLGLATIYFGYLQYLIIPDIRFMGTFGWDVHLFRLVGVQLDPNVTGAMLILTLLTTLHLSFLKIWFKAALSVVTMGSIALTYSRSTFGAVLIGLLSWAFIKRSEPRHVIAAVGLIGILGMMIIGLPRPGGEGVRLERTASGVARVEASQGILSSLSPLEWLVGRGLFVPGNFTQPSDVILGQHAQLADNLIVLFLTGLGIGGLLLLIVVLYRNRRVLSQFTLLATAGTLAILAHSQFNNTLFQPFVWLMLTAIILSSFKYPEKN